MRVSIGVVHCGELLFTTFIGSALSWHDRDRHVVMVRIALRSQKDEISPASTMTATKEEGKGTARGSFRERGEECSVLTARL